MKIDQVLKDIKTSGFAREQLPEDMNQIREILVSYTIQRDIDFQIYWYTSRKSFDQLERMMGSVSIALIAVKNGDGRELGRRVYAINPDCRIIFYGSEDQTLRPLLRSRPIEYHVFSGGDTALKEKLDDILREIADSSGMFQFKSRRRTLLLPTRNIVSERTGSPRRAFQAVNSNLYRNFPSFSPRNDTAAFHS